MRNSSLAYWRIRRFGSSLLCCEKMGVCVNVFIWILHSQKQGEPSNSCSHRWNLQKPLGACWSILGIYRRLLRYQLEYVTKMKEYLLVAGEKGRTKYCWGREEMPCIFFLLSCGQATNLSLKTKEQPALSVSVETFSLFISGTCNTVTPKCLFQNQQP